MMKKQKSLSWGPGFLGNCPLRYSMTTDTRFVFGKYPLEQIDEINEKHTNTRYFKDVVLDENIKAYKELLPSFRWS